VRPRAVIAWVGFLVFARVLLLAVPGTAAAEPVPGTDHGIRETILPNGLKVLTKEIPAAPVVTVAPTMLAAARAGASLRVVRRKRPTVTRARTIPSTRRTTPEKQHPINTLGRDAGLAERAGACGWAETRIVFSRRPDGVHALMARA
jgi:hypothetical protein